jgi:hypothetical protein
VTDEPEKPDAVGAAVALRAVIYRLRGQILSEVNGLEAFVDLTLSMYFVEAAQTMPFRSWVLARIPFSGKLDILEQIAEHVAIAPLVGRSIARLRKANDIRNDQAHSNVSPNPAVKLVSADTMDELFQWHSWRMSRRGMKVTRIEIAELQKDADFVGSLTGEVLRINTALLACSDGRDAKAALESFDSANPGIAEASQRDAQ